MAFKPGETDGQPVEKLNSGNAFIDGLFNGLISFGAFVVVGLTDFFGAIIDRIRNR